MSIIRVLATSTRLMGFRIFVKTNRGFAMNFAKEAALLLAYTFGKTSPKSNNKKVITTTCTTNSSHSIPLKLNKLAEIYVERIMIPTFTKLFAISIVANSCLGFFRKLSKRFASLDFSFPSASISLGLSAKKATSAPEINAEVANNPRRINIEIIESYSNSFKNDTVTMGSGSKVYSLSYT